MIQKPSSMGIAGVEPCQLAPTMGTTGSGSTDSPAPSPTITDLPASARIDSSSPATAVDSASPTTIDIDTASPTIVDTTVSTNVDTALPTIIESTPVFAIDSQVATIVDPISSLMGSTLARTGGFDMAFGLFNFHMDDDGAAELISIIESTCSDDDVYPEAKGKIGNSVSSYSSESTISGSGYVVDYDSDTMIKAGRALEMTTYTLWHRAKSG
jgi:uncharacterized protein YaaQ